MFVQYSVRAFRYPGGLSTKLASKHPGKAYSKCRGWFYDAEGDCNVYPTSLWCQVLERIEKDFSPPQDFAARKMTTVDFPGRYPYRDFGTMYWDAIYTWVDEYLKVN